MARMLVGLFLFVPWAAQPADEKPVEVRIRSAVYAPPVTRLSVETKLVELGVTVRDRQGQPAGGFHASDFEVLDNGKPQQISFFSEERADGTSAATIAAGNSRPQPQARPRYVALFFDDAHTATFGLHQSRLAADKLLTTSLGPADHAAIFSSSGAVIEDFTTDRQRLLGALARLQPRPRVPDRPSSACPTLTLFEAYVITTHLDPMVFKRAVQEVMGCDCAGDPAGCQKVAEGLVQDIAAGIWSQYKSDSSSVMDVLNLAVRHLAGQPGSRVLVLISPGFVSGGMEQQMSGLVDAALRGRIVINSLNAEGLVTRPLLGGRSGGLREQLLTELMSTVSASTGGRYIENSNDYTGGLQTLAVAPSVSYLLGFSPTGEPDGKGHALKVRLKERNEFRVEARSGYHSTLPSEESTSVQERLDREVLSRETRDEFPMNIRVQQLAREAGQSTVRVNISLDANRLKFAKQAGRHIQELTFVTVVQDAAGNFLMAKQAVMDMALTDATLADHQAKGIHAAMTFTVPKGTYQVREIIREAVQNRIAVTNTPLEVR
jgi:VWFA-related protein